MFLSSRTTLVIQGIAVSNCRLIQTTPVQSFNKYAKREVRILNKLISGRQKEGKKVWYGDNDNRPKLPSATFLSSNRGHGKVANRRVNVLNKLFMTNISDMIATGSYSEFILGKQIEISKVKVTNDFQRVNVYWMSKGDEMDEEIQKVLNEAAGSIRHELSQLRLMGEVPRINFLKDKSYFKTVEVENILQHVDFGEECDETTGDDAVEETDCDFSTLPRMRQDVFGLNREEILERITKNLKKTRHAWDKYEIGAIASGADGSTNDEDPVSKRCSSDDEKSVMSANDHEFKKYLERLNYKKPTPDRKKHFVEREMIVQEFNEPIEVQNDVDYLDEESDDKKF